MAYRHTRIDGSVIDLPVGKAVCVGRNYAEHAKELGNMVPQSPMLFIKPSGALCALGEPLRLPVFSTDVHHELELAVLIQSTLSNVSAGSVAGAIGGFALAIDLTARDLQSTLKKNRHPWEIAKGFDGSCPMSPFVASAELADPQAVDLRLTINGEIRQDGNTRDMVFGIHDLIAYISTYFTLLPGDVVLSGTPAGVGPLRRGDQLVLELNGRFQFSARVAE